MRRIIDRRTNRQALSELPYGYSCSFCGAFLAGAVMKGCGIITHCSPGCNFSLNITQLGASGRFSKPVNFASTLLTEKDVIFGGGGSLYDSLLRFADNFDIDFEMVIAGCSAETIGDNISEVSSRAFGKTGKPVLTVNAGGYKGNTVDGYNMALKSIAEQLITDGMPRVDKSVNLIGIIPVHDLFWRGNINEMTRLIQSIGVTVNSVLVGEGMTLADIRRMPSASLNVVVSDSVGIQAAGVISERFGMETVICDEGYPVGMVSSSKWLERVGKALNVSDDIIKSAIVSETNSVLGSVANYISALNDVILKQRYFILADSFYALGIFSYLTGELGMTPEVIAVSTCTDGTLEKIEELCDRFSVNPVIAIDPDNNDVEKLLDETDPTFFIGRGEDIQIARKKGVPLLGLTPTNLRRIQSYPLPLTGFNGGLVILDEIFREVMNVR